MKPKDKPFILEPKVHADDRGIFFPWLADADALPFATGRKVKRIYSVINHAPNVVRGFHFHREEWKIFVIVQGAAKFVALDPENPEDRHVFVSSARKPNVVVIPPGYANGWMSLDRETILVCASTASFDESVKDDTRMDPYKFGDLWGVKGR